MVRCPSHFCQWYPSNHFVFLGGTFGCGLENYCCRPTAYPTPQHLSDLILPQGTEDQRRHSDFPKILDRDLNGVRKPSRRS